jgi:hypothetical protein
MQNKNKKILTKKNNCISKMQENHFCLTNNGHIDIIILNKKYAQLIITKNSFISLFLFFHALLSKSLIHPKEY